MAPQMAVSRSHWPKVDAKVAAQLKENADAHAWGSKKKLIAEHCTPEEWKRLRGASDGGYHSLGPAKIIVPIGAGFAEALVRTEAGE